MKAKKWCSLILAVAFLYMGLPVSRAAITNLINTPTPNTAGSNASQRIRFINAVTIPIGGRVEVTFPQQFNLTSGGDWLPADIILNFQGGPAVIVSDVIQTGQKISFGIAGAPSGVGFQEFTLNAARVINPPTPGTYTVTLTTLSTTMTQLEGTATSASFEIVQDMTAASITVEPDIAGANTKMTVQFRLGSGTSRSLYTGDRIRLAFDANVVDLAKVTTVPGTMARTCLKVNQTNINTDPQITPGIPGTSRGIVEVIVPQNITSSASQGASVTITFETCAGILNPQDDPWQRQFEVTTLRSGGTVIEGPVLSNYYTIRTSVAAPKVFVRPEIVGMNAEYHLSMKVGANSALLKNSGRIDITFPEGTHVPSSIPASAILISTSVAEPAFPCTGTDSPPFEPLVSGHTVSFVMPVDIPANNFICIAIKTSAGLRNPSNPGVYQLKVSTSTDPTPISSQSYSIRLSGRAQVIPEPAKSSENAQYTITFQTGVDGALFPYGTPGVDKNITLTFPNGFVLPPVIAAGLITVNGMATTDATYPIVSQQVSFPVPAVIDNNSTVVIVIKKEAGILNRNISESPEYHSLVIETDKEKGANRIISDEFMLFSPIRDLYVTPMDLGVGVVTRYEVDFKIGDVNEGLKANDKITIEFPQGTAVPTFMATGNVRFQNDAGVSPAAIIISGRSVQLTLPAAFVPVPPPPGVNTVKVIFFESCGIRNPDTPGSYRATVFTSRESTPVLSEFYTIGTVSGQVQVTVTPNTTQYCNTTTEGAAYSIQFVTGATGGLASGQRIMLVFSPEYAPIFTLNHPLNLIPAGRILVNGVPTQTNIVIDNAPVPQHPAGSKILYIPSPIGISSQSTVKIDILSGADIDNPPVSISPQPFYIRVFTDSEPSVISGLYYIVSTVKGIGGGCADPVGVTLTNQSAGMGTDINISFRTGLVGALNPGSDRIRIKFPAGTHVPTFISGQYIRINNVANFATSISVLNPSINDKMVSFEVPYGLTIGNNTTVFVYFLQGSGIVNPLTPGNYQLFVSTTKEPTEVPSVHYTIEGTSVTKPSVSPIPTLAGAEKTQYTIKFMTGSYGSLNIGDTITFDFPAGTVIDPSPPRVAGDPRTISAQHVLVNGVPCIVAPTVISATRVMIYSPIVITPNTRVSIIFAREAKIRNPIAPGEFYTLKMWTMREGSETNPLVSEAYEITSSTKMTKPVVDIQPCTPYSPARYTLEFYTPYALTANTNSFHIDFPSGTFIPSTMDASKILFSTEDNQNIAGQINPVISAYRVTITTPVNIPVNSYVKIDFLRDAGLQNPVAGNYQLKISLNGTPASESESYSYYICPDLDFGRLEITPSSMRIPQGKTQIFVARAYDTDGRLMDYGVKYRWSLSSNIGLLENNQFQSTEFYARNMGSTNLSVIAEYGNRSISTSVVVVVTGPMARIQLTPSGTSTSRGQKTRFSVQAYDANNEPAEGVLYEWSVSPPLGTITPIPLSDDIDFHAESEGQCVLKVRAMQSGLIQEAEAMVTIKVGVNSLKIIPSQVMPNPQPGEVLGPFIVQILNPSEDPIQTYFDTPIHISSTSPHARFSFDSVEWTSSNRLISSISANFSETPPFYISVLEPGDCTIVASSDDYNSFMMPLSVRGHRKKLVFVSAPQNLRRNIVSERISLQIQDILGQPFAVNRDTLIQLDTSSPTGQFSKTIEPWNPVQQLLLGSNQHTLEYYYRDTREGSITISAMHPLYGSAGQVFTVASPGSVSAPEVLVNPAISGVSANYTISFHVGFDGALQASRDEIHLSFPEGTILSPSMAASLITINGNSLLQPPVIDVLARTIRIIVPNAISSTERVELMIPSIKNPEQTGQFNLKVWTSAQPTPVDSQPYRIELSALSQLRCEVVPSIAGSIAEYRISFKTGLKGALERDQEITILFDYAVQVPATMISQHVLINGLPLAFDPLINGKAVTIKTSRAIPSETDVSIVFTRDAGLKNPLYPGMYDIQAYTTSEQALVKSDPFEIVQHSLIRELVLKAYPAMISSPAEYTITFVTGPYGALTQEDTITLVIPDLLMPQSIPSNSVSVNNIRLQQALTISNNTLNIPVPAFIPAGEIVTIIVHRQAGIVNPPRPANDYRMMAHTSKEPFPVTSAPYVIEPKLELSYVLSPANPDGANHWYINQPLLIFTSNVAAKIYYRIGQGPEKEYTEPIRLTEQGEHTVSYRGVSLLGNESDMKSFVYRFDGSAPVIETNLGQEVVYTRETRMAFTFMVKDISRVTLTLNDHPIQLTNNSYSTILELKEGENNYVIRAMDEAGNVTVVHRKIIHKSKPPMLIVTAPTAFQIVQDIYFATTASGSELFTNVRVKGTTEIGVESIEIASDTAKGFSASIQVDHLGNFDRVVGIRSVAGDNTLIFKVSDQVGNETKVIVVFILKVTIRLRIGVETGYVNGTPVQLGTKPYLKYNRHTMVPFRLIAESLGAQVGWDQATRKVSYDFRGTHVDLWIGSKTAEVTDPSGRKRTVTLLAEPELISGRTWVPLRFVSEALGAKVDWDPKLWEAIVSYP